jgi:hypothetical protein
MPGSRRFEPPIGCVLVSDTMGLIDVIGVLGAMGANLVKAPSISGGEPGATET